MVERSQDDQRQDETGGSGSAGGGSSVWAIIQAHLKEEGIDLDGDLWESIRSKIRHHLGEIEGGLKTTLREKLHQQGIDLDIDIEKTDDECGPRRRVKVVCIAPNLKESVREMGQSQRDQVVMVRVDEQTMKSLDDWVGTGAVKSRSEAAALFIREGLNVRSPELAQLREALQEVEEARERLHKKAKEVFGNGAAKSE